LHRTAPKRYPVTGNEHPSDDAGCHAGRSPPTIIRFFKEEKRQDVDDRRRRNQEDSQEDFRETRWDMLASDGADRIPQFRLIRPIAFSGIPHPRLRTIREREHIADD